MEGVLAQWGAAAACGAGAHLAERVEELFLGASMLEAVRDGQVATLCLWQQLHTASYMGYALCCGPFRLSAVCHCADRDAPTSKAQQYDDAHVACGVASSPSGVPIGLLS